MDIIYEIRRRHKVQKQTISAIAREMGISRPTVRKHLKTVDEPRYSRVQPLSPKLSQSEAQLTQWLEQEAKLPRAHRRSAHRLYEGLQLASLIRFAQCAQREPRRRCHRQLQLAPFLLISRYALYMVEQARVIGSPIACIQAFKTHRD